MSFWAMTRFCSIGTSGKCTRRYGIGSFLHFVHGTWRAKKLKRQAKGKE
jgi:hypothetical protein